MARKKQVKAPESKLTPEQTEWFKKANKTLLAIQKRKEYEEAMREARNEARKILASEINEYERRIKNLENEVREKPANVSELMSEILRRLSSMSEAELKVLLSQMLEIDPDYSVYDY